MPSKENFDTIKPNQTIIIPKEKKEKILIELEKIGIHQAYLFPELAMHTNYIVKKIRIANKDINSGILNTRL